MKLTKTKSGNWAKQVSIAAGGKWRFVGNYGTLEQAQAAEAIHAAKGRKTRLTEEVTSATQAKRHGVEVGKVFWRVEAYIAKSRHVMIHATAEECAERGVAPGPCNLPNLCETR